MIWDNLSLFRTNCAIACGARATCCEDFCGCRAGEMASKIPEIFDAFGPQLNAFMSVGILLKYFRRQLLQFERKVVFRCFFHKNFTFLHSEFHKSRRLTAFP